ncbi:MAG: hypothetical protein ABI629_04990 [bacterium]
MLRITVTMDADATSIVLEGRVVGAWAEELSTCWQRVRATAVGAIRVDLDGVAYIDEAGRIILRAMCTDGATLAATTLVMRAIAEEIAGARDGQPRPVRP